MAGDGTFSLSLKRIQGYQFQVKFDWENVAPILADEPEPLGQRSGPNASRLLGAAVGNCLSASLLFCLQKGGLVVEDMETQVTGKYTRNERGRLRVGSLTAEIRLRLSEPEHPRVKRCLELFEDYCVVSGTVRKALPITVRVVDHAGQLLYESTGTRDG